jgi:selenocysteine-specific elongation factor
MSPSRTQVRHVVLGTAGHIDHGKTSLVQRLTGTWTDTLPEERERGMTIDVGYAAFHMPDGTEVGLLDVPGHERLVRTMVAAATAMDLALLVVAADDGPMPQTREHVEILDVLGVERLVVALTKCDLVDEETLEIAEEEVREMLAGTGMAGAPIVRVSAETGQGVEELRTVLEATVPPPRTRGGDDPHVFRMPVLRRFLVPGLGAVLTGIPISGRIALGEKVDVLPAGWTGKVRAIQVHHRDAESAERGHRAALALSDMQVERIKRGMVIATAGVLRPVRRLAVEMRLLRGVRKPLSHGDRARLHVGADQAVARIHLPARAPIPPGGSGLAELEVSTPVVAAPGDRIVLRAENASGTLGGGVVIELLQGRLPHRRQGIVEGLLERAKHLDEPRALVLGCLLAGAERGTTEADVAADTALRPEVVPGLLAELQASREALPVGRQGRWIHAPAFDRVARRVDQALQDLHAKDPAVDNLPLAAVRAAVGRLEPTVVEEALQHLLAKGRLVRTPNGNVRHKEHSSELSAPDRALCESVLGVLARGRGRPPALEDVEAELGLGTQQVLRALKLLDSRGQVFKTETHWFDAAWVEQARERLRAFALEHGGFTPADARGILDSTRKWVIPFLEALDKSGFSRRTGDKRVLR